MAISGFLTHKTEAAQECHSVSMKVAAKTVRVWDPWNTPNRIRCSDWLGNFSQRHTSTKVEPLLSESNSVSLNINKAYKVLGGQALPLCPSSLTAWGTLTVLLPVHLNLLCVLELTLLLGLWVPCSNFAISYVLLKTSANATVWKGFCPLSISMVE